MTWHNSVIYNLQLILNVTLSIKFYILNTTLNLIRMQFSLFTAFSFFYLRFVKKLFMLHVPLHIKSVINIGGVSLWVSSVCWDTK